MEEPSWPEVVGEVFVFVNNLFGETKGMGGGIK